MVIVTVVIIVIVEVRVPSLKQNEFSEQRYFGDYKRMCGVFIWDSTGLFGHVPT